MMELANYDLLSELGHGSFGHVYKAVDKKFNRVVALKIIDTSFSDDFPNIEREAQIQQTLDHPTIPVLYETFFYEGRLIIVMEFIEGLSLLTYLNNKSHTLSEGTICTIFCKILNGMIYLHQNNIIHRDLKMENIMIDEQENVKIIDFGLSKRVKAFVKTMCGSIAYCSPERLKGETYTFAADVWSLGIVLYGMTTLSLPFWNTNNSILRNMILEAEPDFKHYQMSNDLIDLIKRMLVKEWHSRISLMQITLHPFVVNEYPKYDLMSEKKKKKIGYFMNRGSSSHIYLPTFPLQMPQYKQQKQQQLLPGMSSQYHVGLDIDGLEIRRRKITLAKKSSMNNITMMRSPLTNPKTFL